LKNNQSTARTLRKNQTEAEKILWQKLRRRQLYGLRFQRQVAIGNYIADFMCYEAKLIIEVDGGQHNHPTVERYDHYRTMWLQEQGYTVIRFWNQDVLKRMDNVLEGILMHVPPSLSLPRGGGRGLSF